MSTRYKAWLGYGQIEADDCGPDDETEHQLRCEVKQCLTIDRDEALLLAHAIIDQLIDETIDVVQVDLPGWLEVEKDGETYDDPTPEAAAPRMPIRSVEDGWVLYPLQLEQIEPGLFVASIPISPRRFQIQRLLVANVHNGAMLLSATAADSNGVTRDIFTPEPPFELSLFHGNAFKVAVIGGVLEPGEQVRLRVEPARQALQLALLVREL